ncbi:hypothetical protein GUJ93_ZPchr0006g46041 [Zizania palustris]|uniref:Uncharacterized protein n=1 Tax=Zizania palustris TaxID=103762 RepID=A0A8J5TF53_ZIZPA|nr:hypothetical protein GUJ93_ZPchr0006g46041 [Zizania palustris]
MVGGRGRRAGRGGERKNRRQREAADTRRGLSDWEGSNTAVWTLLPSVRLRGREGGAVISWIEQGQCMEFGSRGRTEQEIRLCRRQPAPTAVRPYASARRAGKGSGSGSRGVARERGG